MTTDLRARNQCPHQILREWLEPTFDLFNGILRPSKPTSSDDVKVYYNGNQVPRSGIQSPAQVTLPTPGPFNIIQGVNDTVNISVNGESFQTITLPPGRMVSSSRVLEAFLKALNINVRGFVDTTTQRVCLSTVLEGPSASLYFNGGTATNSLLGLPQVRFFWGSLKLPGWSLVQDPLVPSNVDPYRRVILFNEPLEIVPGGVFEVDYATLRGSCRRCASLNLEWDHRYDSNGDPILARDVELLLQETEKIVLTIKGTQPFQSWYGSSIETLIGSKLPADIAYLETQLSNEIRTTLEKYQSVKSQQARLQPTTDSEFLVRVLSVEVTTDPDDPTFIFIQIRLQNRAGEVETLNRALSLASIRPDLLAPRQVF
jgi:hypothetical protein